MSLLVFSVAAMVNPAVNLIRDPFYISSAVQDPSPMEVPKILGIVSVQGKKSAFICFCDGQKKCVSEGDTVRGLEVMTINDSEVVVRDGTQKEMRWMM